VDHLKTTITIGLFAALLLVTAGCLSLGASNVTDQRLSQGLLVYVEDSTDARDRGFKYFEHGMGDRGTSIALEHFNWSPQVLGLAKTGLPDRTDSGEAATNLARSLRHYAIVYPGRPIYVVAHGHGCHVALNALEELDPRVSIDRLVLLVPGVDPYRDLSPALARVSDRCLAYTSFNDLAHGVTGPFLLGTHDTSRAGATAAFAGFTMPEIADPVQYEKLYQLQFAPEHLLDLNFGTHEHAVRPWFIRNHIRPFLLDGKLPDRLEPEPEE
jgi:hypothetical protein